MTKPARRFYIYIIFNLNGTPCYIGKAQGRHINRYKSTKRIPGNPKLKAVLQAGEGHLPIVLIRDNLLEEEAFTIEIALIKIIGKEPNGPLLNMTDGGPGMSGLPINKGKVWNEEQRKRHSIILSGRKLSPEHRAKIAKANIGRPMSEATKEKHRANRLGRLASEEWKENISKGLKRHYANKNGEMQ